MSDGTLTPRELAKFNRRFAWKLEQQELLARSELKREEDRAQITELYLQGVQIAEIARKMGRSFKAVQLDLEVVRRRWLTSQVRDFERAKAEELAKINRIEQEAWEAWMRSKNKRTRTRSQRTKKPVLVMVDEINSQEQERTERTILTVETNEQVGDPRFMSQMAWCVEMRSKILGILAPQKIAPTNPEGDQPYNAADLSLLSAEELHLLNALWSKAAGRRDIAAESRPVALPMPTELYQPQGFADERFAQPLPDASASNGGLQPG